MSQVEGGEVCHVLGIGRSILRRSFLPTVDLFHTVFAQFLP